MAQKKNIRKRLLEVFNNWIECCDDEELLEIKEKLDEILDEWHGEDRFGTEGQCDPRGDARSINNRPKI